MIAAPEGLEAHYERQTNKGTARHIAHDVIAFDDDGTPLVLGGKRNGWGLVPASTYSGFTGVRSKPDMPFVAALPAGGWRVEYADDDGKKWSEPIIGWAVTSDGYGVALVSAGEGIVEPVDREIRVYHDEEPRQGS